MNNKHTIGIAVALLLFLTPGKAQQEVYPQHFNLEEVRLIDGPLKQAMDLNDSLLFEYDADRLMTALVEQSGLDSNKNSKYYQWSSKHPVYPIWYYESTFPHYLSALSLAYAATDNNELRERLYEKISHCLEVTRDCGDAFSNICPQLDGYVGTEPLNDMWRQMYDGNADEFYRYSGWCPFYYVHKMLAGFRDTWMYAGFDEAKEMWRKMSDWSVEVISKVSDSQLQKVLETEHGGMAELLTDAYSVFGNEKYLLGAKRYIQDWLLNGMQTVNTSLLNGQHANSTVPKFMGCERIYQEELRKNGMEVSTIPPEEVPLWQEATLSVRENFIRNTGDLGQQLVNQCLAANE